MRKMPTGVSNAIRIGIFPAAFVFALAHSSVANAQNGPRTSSSAASCGSLGNKVWTTTSINNGLQGKEKRAVYCELSEDGYVRVTASCSDRLKLELAYFTRGETVTIPGNQPIIELRLGRTLPGRTTIDWMKSGGFRSKKIRDNEVSLTFLSISDLSANKMAGLFESISAENFFSSDVADFWIPLSDSDNKAQVEFNPQDKALQSFASELNCPGYATIFPHPSDTSPTHSSTAKRIAISSIGKEYILSAPPSVVPVDFPSGASATAVIRIEIGTDGRVKSAKVEGVYGKVDGKNTNSWPPSVGTAAVDAVMHWQFKPYLIAGQPAEASTIVNVPFPPHN